MTVRQIRIGSAIGFAVAGIGLFGPYPGPMVSAGLLVVLFSMIAGGMDGTLPRP